MKSKLLTYLENIGSVEIPKLRDGNDESIKSFYQNCIEPVLPNPNTVNQWHRLLIRYSEDPEAIFFIRRFGSDANKNWNNIRRGFLTEYQNGSGYVFCDNFFAHYFFVMAIDGFVPDYDDFKLTILRRSFPYGSARTKEEAPLQAYPKGKASKLNNNGWKLAHLFSVNGSDYAFNYKQIRDSYLMRGERDEWEICNKGYVRRMVNRMMLPEERRVLKAHFLRLTNPLNYFLVPKPSNEVSKFGNGIGEDRSFLDYVFTKFNSRYPDAFPEYLSKIEADLSKYSTNELNDGNTIISIKYVADKSDLRSKVSCQEGITSQKDLREKSTRKVRHCEISEDDLHKMARLYLEQGLSFRKLEKQVLHIDSAARGGGFIAKKALNGFGLTNENKGALTDKQPAIEYASASGRYKEVLGILYKDIL